VNKQREVSENSERGDGYYIVKLYFVHSCTYAVTPVRRWHLHYAPEMLKEIIGSFYL
jgi:hypothetical protein